MQNETVFLHFLKAGKLLTDVLTKPLRKSIAGQVSRAVQKRKHVKYYHGSPGERALLQHIDYNAQVPPGKPVKLILIKQSVGAHIG